MLHYTIYATKITILLDQGHCTSLVPKWGQCSKYCISKKQDWFWSLLVAPRGCTVYYTPLYKRVGKNKLHTDHFVLLVLLAIGRNVLIALVLGYEDLVIGYHLGYHRLVTTYINQMSWPAGQVAVDQQANQQIWMTLAHTRAIFHHAVINASIYQFSKVLIVFRVAGGLEPTRG